jgi:hypothetical protein
MTIRIPTIAALIAAPNGVQKVLPASGENPENIRLDVALKSELDGQFFVFVRVLRALNENFSIGLRYELGGFGSVVLLRVNGDHGGHKNPDGGVISEGPHVHTFRSPQRDRPPRAGAEARWAWPLPADHLALPTAWRTFCGLVALVSNAKVDKKIAALYTSTAQLSLGTIS